MRQAAPAGVRGGHHTEPSVANEQRYAVRALHRNHPRRVSRQQDVRLGKGGLGLTRQRVGHDDGSAVHLLKAHEFGRRLAEGRGHVRPHAWRRAPVAERPDTAREEMQCHLFERQADQRRSECGIAPLEGGVGGRQYHVRVSTIIGLGIDATDIPRIVSTIERYGARFIQRIFTEGEIADCQRRRESAVHFAGRFAAKEAAMKALGTGHTPQVLWRDVEVVRTDGPPSLAFHGGARRRFEAMGAGSSLLTITHSDTLAIAQVMLVAR